MKYCKNCGVQLDDDAKFCTYCGTNQEGSGKYTVSTDPYDNSSSRYDDSSITAATTVKKKSGLLLAAGILMIIACATSLWDAVKSFTDAATISSTGVLAGTDYESLVELFALLDYTMEQTIQFVCGLIKVSAVFSLLALAWRIPMTVHVFRSRANGTPIGTGFKVCTLLFVSFIGGILLLIDKSNKQ
jgi:hypothetical protein